MNLLKILVLFLIYIVSINTAFGVNFYANCIKGNEVDSTSIETVILGGTESKCRRDCTAKCNMFSKKNNGIEINQHVISSCITKCQHGENFSSTYYNAVPSKKPACTGQYAYDTYTKLVLMPALTIESTCKYLKSDLMNDIAKKSIYATKFQEIKQGDKISVTLVRSSTNTNKIYKCGYSVLNFTPLFPNNETSKENCFDISRQGWNKNVQDAWRYTSAHECTATSTSAALVTKPIENKIDMSPNMLVKKFVVNGAKLKKSNAAVPACSWNARNKDFLRTRLFIRDKDELSISWYGNYSYNGKKNDYQNIVSCICDNAKQRCLHDVKSANKKKALLQDLMNNTSIQTALLDSSGNLHNIKPLTGEAPANYKTSKFKSSLCSLKVDNIADHWYGLEFFSSKMMRSYNNKAQSVPKNKASKSKAQSMPQHKECLKIDAFQNANLHTEKEIEEAKHLIESGKCMQNIQSIGYPHYSYKSSYNKNGTKNVIKGWPAKGDKELLLRHYVDKNSMALQNAVGGYNLQIEWGGCPGKEDYSDIEYAIGNDISQLNWIPITNFSSNGVFEINSTTNGKLHFRLKPYSGMNYATGMEYAAWDIIGDYRFVVRVSKEGDDLLTLKDDGTIAFVVHSIRNVLLNKSTNLQGSYGDFNESTVGRIFGNITEKKSTGSSYVSYVFVVQCLLVFYIMFTAIGFMIGVLKISHKEVIIRILKLAVVTTFISGTSWRFFSEYVMPLLIDGSFYITAKIVGTIIDVGSNESVSVATLENNPLAIFGLFDEGFASMILSKTVFAKLTALIFSGFFGIVTLILIVSGIIFYVFTIVRVTFVYCLSIVGIAFMIILAPIVLPCILFNTTKEIFNSWFKQLLSFCIQPAVVMSGVVLFIQLVHVLFKLSLNFTVCEVCWFQVLDWCIVPGYALVDNMHMPGSENIYYSPPKIFMSAIAFVLVSYFMSNAAKYLSSITARIITQIPHSTITNAIPF